MGLRTWFINRITKRPPDFVIGADDANRNGVPYLSRWWVIPRNKRFNIYLHHFTHSDDDRALHDHPWWNVSILLFGSYIEHMPNGVSKVRKQGAIVGRKATALHRVELFPKIGFDDRGLEEPVWTLFITGPKIRDWGFACPKGWKPWQAFCAVGNSGEVGPGCAD